MIRPAIIALVGLGVGLAACEPAPEPARSPVEPSKASSAAVGDTDAQAVIARARAAHGVAVLDSATVTFTFRGTPFTVERDGGRFAYTRDWSNAEGAGRDVLSNEGLIRTIDGAEVELSRADYLAAEEAVNSVVYFALLPYALADDAVQPRLAGADTLAGEPYDLLEVTFRPEGGGRDYQDRFLYWVHQTRSTIDYLAYSYEVSGGGARFRRAVNPRTVGGVRFVDYINFSAEPLDPPLERLGRLWEADSLDLLSEIVLDDVHVVQSRSEDV